VTAGAPERRTAVARDGTPIAYALTSGRGGRRFALVHSLAMDAGFWDGVAERLVAHGDVLAVDCRGHGASGKPPGPYTVEGFADDLADVMDAAGWPSAVVGGASMGGCVALAFGARHAARTDGLGLIDTTAWYGEQAPAQWEERAGKAVAGGMAALVGFQETRWFSDRFRADHPDRVRAAVEVFLRNDVAAYVESCRMLGRADLRAALPGFRFPCRIVVGEEDHATPPAMAEAMAGAIPRATMRVLPGVRHFTPMEVPGTIAEELAALAG
jgi:3-oxoadipate enol-lactonase